MKHTNQVMATAVLFLTLIPAIASAQRYKTGESSMTVWQARRVIVTGAHHQFPTSWHLRIDRSSYRFTHEGFELDAQEAKKGTRHFRVNLSVLRAVSVRCSSWGCQLAGEDGKLLPSNETGGFLNGVLWDRRVSDPEPLLPGDCSSDCVEHNAGLYAAALNRLRAFARDTKAPLLTFGPQAAAWRALPSKPAIPEEVRVQLLLAESALKEKRLEEALTCYETGLEFYPTWPQGYFNAALIAGELGFYAQAVEHMQSYLELVPEAPDAQSARDQITIWLFKAKRAVN